MKRLENKHIWLVLDTSDFFKGETVIRGGAQNHLCPMINTKPHTDTEKVWGEIEAIFHEQTGLSDIAKFLTERGIKGQWFEEY